MNYVPLSVMMVFGTPNLWMISMKNNTACLDLIRLIGRASIQLENLFIATSRWVKPLGAFYRGPTMLSPHTANGHVMGMVCRARAGRCVCQA